MRVVEILLEPKAVEKESLTIVVSCMVMVMWISDFIVVVVVGYFLHAPSHNLIVSLLSCTPSLGAAFGGSEKWTLQNIENIYPLYRVWYVHSRGLSIISIWIWEPLWIKITHWFSSSGPPAESNQTLLTALMLRWWSKLRRLAQSKLVSIICSIKFY